MRILAFGFGASPKHPCGSSSDGKSFANAAARQAALGPMLIAMAIAAATSGPASALNDDALRASSEVKGVEFRLLGAVPKAPASAASRADNCGSFAIQPTSEAGKLVADRGWGVTSEALLGPYQAVSFAGKFEPGTSGSCAVSEGNVGVFLKGRLLALAYVQKSSEQSIGRITPLEGGGLRVWDGSLGGGPIGDVHFLDGYWMRLGALPAEDLLCGGKAVGQPIDKARNALMSKGWRPEPKKREADDAQPELLKRGIVEVDECSGTGFGFCNFSYSGDGGALSVTTIGGEGDGEFPAVMDYEVTCAGARTP